MGEMEGVMSGVVVGVAKLDVVVDVGLVSTTVPVSLKFVIPGTESCVEEIAEICGGLELEEECCDFEDEDDDFRLLLHPSPPLRCLDDEEDEDFLDDRLGSLLDR